MLILHGLVQTRPLKTIKTVLEKQKQAARLMSSDDISDGIFGEAFNKGIENFKYVPNKHSTTSFIYVQSQKQHNSQSIQPSIFINRSHIPNKIF